MHAVEPATCIALRAASWDVASVLRAVPRIPARRGARRKLSGTVSLLHVVARVLRGPLTVRRAGLGDPGRRTSSPGLGDLTRTVRFARPLPDRDVCAGHRLNGKYR